MFQDPCIQFLSDLVVTLIGNGLLAAILVIWVKKRDKNAEEKDFIQKVEDLYSYMKKTKYQEAAGYVISRFAERDVAKLRGLLLMEINIADTQIYFQNDIHHIALNVVSSEQGNDFINFTDGKDERGNPKPFLAYFAKRCKSAGKFKI